MTETLIPSIEPTLTSPSPSATTFITLSPSPKPTQAQTSTPLSTLPPDQAQAILLNLLETNGGCRLPCWWGFVPDQTQWQSAESYLATFALDIKQGSSTDRPLYSVYFLVPEEIWPVALIHNYQVIDGIIESIEVIPGRIPTYTLAAFLGEYGPPAEVRIRTFSQAREGSLRFDTVLFYPRDGILVRYTSQAKAIADRIQACPQQNPAIVLALWSPKPELTFAEATSRTVEIQDDEGWPYQPLEETTRLDVKEFYEIFVDLDNTTCLETPAGLWPQP